MVQGQRIKRLEKEVGRLETGHAQQHLEIIELKSRLRHYQETINAHAECLSELYQLRNALEKEK